MNELHGKILAELARVHNDVKCGLDFGTPFQLLVATMLSAQSTDKTVNKVTEKLFAKYPSLDDFLGLSQDDLEAEIKQIGIYKNKAKNILAASRELKERFGGEVPQNLDDLVTLPGVGRKTANVVLSNAFDIDAIAVDTHVFRVSNRLGLAHSDNVLDTEKQLMEAIPKAQWSIAHHWLIWHGRLVCSAIRPKCEICTLAEYCGYYSKREVR